MATTYLAPTIAPKLDPASVARFMVRFEGRVIQPESSTYDEARRVWNGMIDRRPALIAKPANAAGVRRAVHFAREHDLPISIKGGGHGVAGFAVAEGGLMLDLSALRGVRLDSLARITRVEGGATWGDFDAATAAAGLATTGGVISSTGVAGLTLGGGIGWLVGKHGMSIDNLLAVELVTADGELVRASQSEHPDLFWALRGGGGNFGVATAFEFSVHPLREVVAGIVVHPIAEATALMEFYREVSAPGVKPDELGLYLTFPTDPETGSRVAIMALCWSGDPARGQQVVEPLLAFGSPLLTQVEPMPYLAWQQAFDAEFPHGRRYYWKGTNFASLPDGLFEAIAEGVAEAPLPNLTPVVEGYGGAMQRIGASETAFPHREARYQLVITGGWDDPADDERGRAWVRDLHAAARPHGLAGAFHNFNSVDGADRQGHVRAGFGPNWPRLVAAKRRYDPDNVFRLNNNIAP